MKLPIGSGRSHQTCKMRKNERQKSLERVKEIVETCDGKQRIRALKNLIREGRQSGDRLLIGAAHHAIADACRDADDQIFLLDYDRTREEGKRASFMKIDY